MNIDKALKINGWMYDVELGFLAEQAVKHAAIAEIGAWMGRTTRALADNTQGTVYAVDTWQGSAEHGQFLKTKWANYLFEEFQRNLNDHIASGKVFPIREPSLEAAEKFAVMGMTFDMIFIDAAHDYVNVHADILAWQKLLSPRGLLCGHDFDAGRDGVVRAVKELVPGFEKGPGSIWYKDEQLLQG